MSDPDAVARAGFEALRQKDWTGVLTALGDLEVPDRPLLDARLHGWRAQAFRALNRLDEAERAIGRAIRQARVGGDAKGVAELRSLQAGILAALAAARTVEVERARDAALADLDEATLLAEVAPDERAALLVRQGSALADAGRSAEAATVAKRAEDLATNARDRVLALLLRARVTPPEAPIRAAHAIADAEGDHDLLTAVAHAARAAKVTLLAPEFG